jgi:hypothetical protein
MSLQRNANYNYYKLKQNLLRVFLFFLDKAWLQATHGEEIDSGWNY